MSSKFARLPSLYDSIDILTMVYADHFDHPTQVARVLEPSLFYGIPLPLPFPTLFAEGGSCGYASIQFLLKFLESGRAVPLVGARHGFCLCHVASPQKLKSARSLNRCKNTDAAWQVA